MNKSIFIRSVIVENWKVFSGKKVFYFENGLNVICQQNGFGKSSIFQAVEFALFGITPLNTTFTSLANDPEKETRVRVKLSSGHEFNRSFCKGKTTLINCTLKKETVAVGNKASIETAEDLIGQKSIIQAIWHNDDKVLNWSFFQNEVVNVILEDPIRIHDNLKKKIFSLKKTIPNKYRSQGEIEKDIEANKAEIDSLSTFGGDSKTIKSAQYHAALKARDSYKELREILYSWNDVGITFEEAQKIQDLVSLHGAKIDEYREIASRLVDSEYFADFDFERIKAISDKGFVSYVVKHGKEPLTGQALDQEVISSISILAKAYRAKQMIADIEDATEKLDQAAQVIRIHQLESTVNRCANYEEIIAQYDSEMESATAKLKSLTYKVMKLEEEARNTEKIIATLSEIKHLTEMKDWTFDYLKKATGFYSQQFLSHCNDFLTTFNDRYISIDMYDGVFYLTKASTGMPVAAGLLSSGERAIITSCIRLAIASMFGNLPLLFDESFANLDTENLAAVKNALNHHSTLRSSQLFVITHDESWRKEVE